MGLFSDEFLHLKSQLIKPSVHQTQLLFNLNCYAVTGPATNVNHSIFTYVPYT